MPKLNEKVAQALFVSSKEYPKLGNKLSLTSYRKQHSELHFIKPNCKC